LENDSQGNRYLSQRALQLQEHIRELETLAQIEYEVAKVNLCWNHEDKA